MSFQPLFQTDEAGKTILDFTKDELLPAVKSLEKLAIEIADYRINFWNSFFRKRLSDLQKKYQKENKKFLDLYHKYSTPDELFSQFNSDSYKDKQKIGMMIGDYFNSRQAVLYHFEQGFKLLEIIDRQITRYYQSADQRVAVSLSIIAITISVIITLIK